MKNFPIMYNGEEYWYHRATAVCGKIIALSGHDEYVLAVKRGPAVTHPGQWGLPGGYLDFDETIEQAFLRELHEETGLKLAEWEKPFVIDAPSTSSKQTIVFVYPAIIYGKLPEVTNKFAEPNEIDEVKWIPLVDINKYDWMYNQSYKDKVGLWNQ